MSLLILRGLLLTAEALAISALLPLLAWLTNAFLRRNAALRHLVWLSVFAVLVTLPLLALILPPRVLHLPAAPPVPVDVAMAAPVTAVYVDHISIESIIAVLAAPLCALWLLGVSYNLLRLGLGAHGLMRLRRNSTAFQTVEGCDVRLGAGPLTFGWLKPIILLPNDAPSWPKARLDAVLAHELAHVRRRDSITQWLAALACAFYWPNPLMWLGARALRRDAEMAADDAVLAGGVQASGYAAELLRLASDARGPRYAVAMAAPSALEARVKSVLSPTPSRKGVTRMDALRLACLGSTAALALALARPDIALAQAPVTTAPLAAPTATQNSSASSSSSSTTDGTLSTQKDGMKVETHFHHTAKLSPEQREEIRQAQDEAREQAREARDQAREAARQTQEEAREQAREAQDQARETARQAREEARQAEIDVKVELANRKQVEKTVTVERANAAAWRQAAAEIHQAVARALDEVRPYIREASRDPQAGERVGAKVSAAMAKVQPQIDAAIARASAVRVEVKVPVPPEPALPPVPPAPVQ